MSWSNSERLQRYFCFMVTFILRQEGTYVALMSVLFGISYGRPPPLCHQQLTVKETVFSLTLARSPMASRSYRQASDFLNYSPGLASDILAERKSEKKEEKNFFKKNCFPKQP